MSRNRRRRRQRARRTQPPAPHRPRRRPRSWWHREYRDITPFQTLVITLLIAAGVTGWYAVDEYRYWGEPVERGLVVAEHERGRIGAGKGSCAGADFTLTVRAPRPGFPDTVEIRDCASYWDVGDHVRLSRRADAPHTAKPDVLPPRDLPFVFVGTALAIGALLALVVAVRAWPWKTGRRVRAGR